MVHDAERSTGVHGHKQQSWWPTGKNVSSCLETDLIDLHHHCYPSLKKPATHQHGSQPINLMAGFPLMANTLLYAWMCPFSNPPTIKGDHRLMGLDFNPEILFETLTTALANLGQCGAKSWQIQMVTKYCKCMITKCTQQQLAEWTDYLFMCPTFGPEHYWELEQINTKLTNILTKADHACYPTNNAPW